MSKYSLYCTGVQIPLPTIKWLVIDLNLKFKLRTLTRVDIRPVFPCCPSQNSQVGPTCFVGICLYLAPLFPRSSSIVLFSSIGV